MSVNDLDRLIYGVVENHKRLLGQNLPHGPALTRTTILLHFPWHEILLWGNFMPSGISAVLSLNHGK